jgi:hypothetical protein
LTWTLNLTLSQINKYKSIWTLNPTLSQTKFSRANVRVGLLVLCVGVLRTLFISFALVLLMCLKSNINIILQVGLHPEFENSRCLFIVRKDGEQVDFSFWKCIKGLIRKKYPLYADSFILRHFGRRQDY